MEWGLEGRDGHVVEELESKFGNLRAAVCGGGGSDGGNFQRVSMLTLRRGGGCSVLVV